MDVPVAGRGAADGFGSLAVNMDGGSLLFVWHKATAGQTLSVRHHCCVQDRTGGPQDDEEGKILALIYSDFM